MRGILEAMHDYPDEALGLCFFLIAVIWLLSCIFGSLLKDDCNIKDEIIDISKHIKEKLISNKME